MNRTAKVEQVRNGYIISYQTGLTGEQEVYDNFEEVITRLLFYFDVKKEAED